MSTAAPFKVKAVYDYASQESDDLSFPLGQIITVTEEIDNDWYEGEYTDITGTKQAGIFPNNFVERYEPEVPSRPSRPTRPVKELTSTTTSPALGTQAETTNQEDTQHAPEETELASTQTQVSEKPTESVISAPALPKQNLEEPSVKSVPQASILVPAETKKPPPVAPKSNAFKDRIAAFNQPAAAPILPFTPGQRAQQGTFVKKAFVAPPPSKDSYVPPPKQEAAYRPYVREEDPEIKQRQEEDQLAAQSAGLLSDERGEDDEQTDAPKPQSLKDRIALLQKQQLEQAHRRADAGTKKEKKPPPPPRDAQTGDDTVEMEEDEADIRDADATIVDDHPSASRASTDSVQSRPLTQPTPSQRRPPNPVMPAIPQHEILSGGEEADQSAAGETEEDDDADTIGADDGGEDVPVQKIASRQAPAIGTTEASVQNQQDDIEPEEGDEEDEIDEETRRKLELRERMAKMSGGMGMAGMFGPPGAMPLPAVSKKRSANKERKSTDDSTTSAQPTQARIPVIPMEGLQRVQSPEIIAASPPSVDNAEAQVRSLPAAATDSTTARPVPPVPPPESRPSIPAVTSGRPVGLGLNQEFEQSTSKSVVETPGSQTPLPNRGSAPNVPSSASIQNDDRTSYFGAADGSQQQQTQKIQANTTGGSFSSPKLAPPAPPKAVHSGGNVHDQDHGESEYEGDYDTDIGSSAKHKDALRSHAREPSMDDSTSTIADDEAPFASPAIPDVTPAPTARAVPPPPPSAVNPQMNPKPSRQSTDLPRAPPPPIPSAIASTEEDEYDPYRYANTPAIPATAAPSAIPPVPPRINREGDDEGVDALRTAQPSRKSIDRLPPPPPPASDKDQAPSVPAMPPTHQQVRSQPRHSLDVQRGPAVSRRSMDQTRQSGEHGQIAADIDLSESSLWWTSSQPLPPVLHSRVGIDILTESEESTTAKRGGRTTVNKDIYVLYLDYSQTIITARYDSGEPSDVVLDQRHEAPPAKLRQDQLEQYWTKFGRHIAEAAAAVGNSKKESTVGDGTAAGLVSELVKARPDALMSVGTRAYGALVYANLANASVMQFDEIRPGDVLTLRNAKFEGKHSGPMHQKYKQELGPSHVALVHEWDGTKKKLRAWEQGREKKAALRSESYRLADLKSGEVRVWRVVGREWVGWENNT